MSRLNAQQAATFPANAGRTSFLSLQNDKDSAVVRFAYVNVDDIPRYLIHEIPGEDGKNKQVGCLKTDFSQPHSVCPLCANGSVPKKTMYFNVRNEETGEMQIWQRTETFFEKNLETLFREYEKMGTPLCSIPFKIIRNGVKGDNKTSYTLIALPVDNMSLDQFPDDIVVEEVGIVKDFSFNELQEVVRTGVLPSTANNANNTAVTPRGNVANENAPTQAAPMQSAPVNNNRRTIMNNGGY